MKRTSILAALLTMAAAAVSAEPVEIQAGQTKVTLEFFTPQTVRVVKTPQNASAPTAGQSLVVIAKPGDVDVKRSGNTVSSSGRI